MPEMTPCSNCEVLTETDLCEDCENLIICEECGKLGDEDHVRCVENEFFCFACYERLFVECADCGEALLIENRYAHSESSEVYCESCYHEHFYYCADCDCDHEVDDDSCQRIREFHGLCVHPYGFKPYPLFHRAHHEKESTPTCGFELEIELGASLDHDSGAKIFQSLDNLVYVKEDSSLRKGIEIVSHPMTYDAFRDLSVPLSKMLSWLRDSGYDIRDQYGTETCGMHVHIGRNAFTRLSLYKLLSLIFSDPTFVTLLSGRKSVQVLNSYACPVIDRAVIDYVGMKSGKRKLFIRQACRSVEIGKYWAVNTAPSNTVEFRFFASTLSTERFKANMQLVWALQEFITRHSMRQMVWPEFIRYAQTVDTKYPEMAALFQQLSV